MGKPSVRVIMPVYNGEKFIRQAIESVKAQTFTDWELYIVDDGSTDNTAPVIKEKYPTENVIPGNGYLFWARGMRLAWSRTKAAIRWYKLLNDDTILLSSALI